MDSTERAALYRLHAEFCKTLADANRLLIIAELSAGELSVGELTRRLDLRQANVCKHLSLMRARGLLRSRRSGATVYYFLSDVRICQAINLLKEVQADQLGRQHRLSQVSPRLGPGARSRNDHDAPMSKEPEPCPNLHGDRDASWLAYESLVSVERDHPGMTTKRRGWLGLQPHEKAAYYDDTDKTCRECGAELSGRRTRFCSTEHSKLFWDKRDWRGVRRLVFKRDDWTCQRCHRRFWPKWKGLIEADHIVPIADGGDEFDMKNVQTLCVPCHKIKTKEGRQQRAKQNTRTTN